ncbi:MAG TPA: class I SAM-dependent methyltransferase [Gemmatimonadaceae bacterium]|nr:class I SAM-dependent methyltransferase [Gemmatimonadaceae bacterium]
MASGRSRPFYERTLPYRAMRFLFSPSWKRFRDFVLQRRYRRNAFDKTLDWGWGETHFNRIALVNLLVSRKQHCSYLEIGCATNDLFNSVATPDKTGVDPERGGTIRKTSDDFFLSNDLSFDVIFIDGLHTYEQVHKDVVNSMMILKPGGWIAIHDLLPSAWIEHHRPLLTRGAWTGDVWKVAFELARTEGIDFKILKIDFGVGVLRLTRENPELVDMAKELRDKEFAYFYENVSKLPVVEWDDAQEWLRS